MRATSVWFVLFVLAVLLLVFIFYRAYDNKQSFHPPDPSPNLSAPIKVLESNTDEVCGFRWKGPEANSIAAMRAQAEAARNNLLRTPPHEITSIEVKPGGLQIVISSTAWPKDRDSRCALLERLVRTAKLDGAPSIPFDVSVQGRPLEGAASMHDAAGDYFHLLSTDLSPEDQEKSVDQFTDEVYRSLQEKGLTR